jgi:saccharopine dehydrogenase-like NADP-dependent oxidoreductase
VEVVAAGIGSNHRERGLRLIRILVLGAAGQVASHTVRELVAEQDVSAVTVADRDYEAAMRLASELGDRVSAVAIDANDHIGLVAASRGHDVVANAIDPFRCHEARVAHAAIEAGVPYVSLCDDYDSARTVLVLDDAARVAGVTVLSGMGWTPGLSNVLARKAAERFDLLDEVNVAWGGSAVGPEGYAVILQVLDSLSGLVPSYQNGRHVHLKAGTGREAVLFPPPVGRLNCYHLRHPEPLTLPRFLPGLRVASLKGGFSEQALTDLVVGLARLGLADTKVRRDLIARLVKAAAPYARRLGTAAEPCSALRVDAGGWENGAYRQVSYGVAAPMHKLTALPLAVGALMLGRGVVRVPGVVAPEACIEPSPFLADLEGRGVTVQDMTGRWAEPEGVRLAPSAASLVLIALAAWFLLGWLHGRRARG